MNSTPIHPPLDANRRHDDLYAERPPWDIDRPQPALRTLADAGAVRGRVLDVGCGTGEHALMAAGLGLDATGVDLAGNALDTAREKARERGLTVRFLRHDALRLTELGETFDTVLDCGLFHIFTGDDRETLVDGLRSVLRPGGRYLMLCFSDQERNTQVPHRLSRAEIEAAFTDGWRIDAIDAATIDTIVAPEAVRAWLVAVTRS